MDFSEDTETQGAIPGYLLAADNHNLGNTRGGSWFDPDSWGQKFENAGSMIATGMLSGANSFYNTGVTIGNWFGAEAELNDTKDWISGLDSDLGAYYDKNRTAADLVGFIAGSLIPGLGGIKVLNAGQVALRAATKTGLIGENLSKATGLLIPQTEKYIALAAKDINSAVATFSSINSNGVKALGAGLLQNTLEAAAFETAVQATMFKSPILDGQDSWDILKNVAIGGAVGGVIGGAFSAASSLGKIKKLVTQSEKELKPFSARNVPEESLSPANKIILMTEDKEAALFPTHETNNMEIANKLAVDKLRRIDNDIRTEVHAMVKGDSAEIGNMVADTLPALPKSVVLQNLLHAEEIAPISKLTAIEKEVNKAAKEGKMTPELQTSYVKLTGEGAGVSSDIEPAVVNLADKVHVPAGATTESAVLSRVRDEKFTLSKLWSALDVSGVTGHLTAEARHIWASKLLKELPDELKISQYDIPVLERALKDGKLDIQLVDKAGGIIQKGFSSGKELESYIIQTKEIVANELLRSHVLEGTIPLEQGTAAISKIVNTKLARLEGTSVGSDSSDYFAWQSGLEEYNKFLADRGLTTPASASADPRFLPTYAKISRRIQDMNVNGHEMDGMAWVKTQQQMLRLAVDNVVSKAVGNEIYSNIPTITDAALLNSNRYGSGAKLFSFANGGYGTLESTAQLLGSITKQIKVAFREMTADVMTGPLANLGRSQEHAIEFETINQKITRSAKQWVLDEEGLSGEARALITTDLKKALADGGELAGGTDGIIPIVNEEVYQAIQAHIARSGVRTTSYRELRSAQGLQDVRGSDVFRPIRPSPEDYKYIAFVKDPQVTGQGHTSMIFASSESDLQKLLDKVPPQYQSYTKRDILEFKKAREEYDHSRALNESYIDNDLKNRGIFSNFYAKTDPQKIVNDVLNQHLREDDVLAVELMRAKNEKAFNFLEDQGNAYTKVAASKFGGYSDRIEAAGKNPYLDYIKTALDISKVSEHPLLYSFNKFLDTAVSKAVDNIGQVFAKAKTPEDLENVNKLLQEYGMSTGYRDAATDLLANHTAPKGELTKFIRGANAILSKLTLGLDPLNAVNNFIGANILRSTELKQITDAIRSGDTALAGELGKLLNVKLPGVSDSIITPSKLVANALRNYVQDDGTLLAKYKQLGVIKDASQQFKSILDDFTLKGTESVQDLSSRINRALAKATALSETGEKFTGNKLAEELNRFISADAMRQLTDLGVKKGILTSTEQNSYINTFVNRVEGNTLATQRPLMFQGPIGQAIGLFQSYQFNLMQQMFRYVAEGSAKDSAMLLGLQGTFYGIQGLPAFQFINQHIVGSFSGNPKHVDLYDATYGIAGREAGDLALYGLPSNLLQANLYSRGDINPRQVTILPSSLSEVPFIGAFGKFLGSMKETVSKVNNGGNVWESFLQGLEHNGLSRPLAGIAQTLQSTGPGGTPYSTTGKGSILFSNDLMSWATATRLAGGRPLDEAIINDGVFRIQSYTQQNNARMQLLGEAVKSTTIQGNQPSEDEVIRFAKIYAENGGKQGQFNKFMMNNMKAANTSQVQKITSQLNHPFAQKMQLLMGGGSDVTPVSLVNTPQ